MTTRTVNRTRTILKATTTKIAETMKSASKTVKIEITMTNKLSERESRRAIENHIMTPTTMSCATTAIIAITKCLHNFQRYEIGEQNAKYTKSNVRSRSKIMALASMRDT